MKSLSLQYRLILITLVPVTLLVALFSTYVVNTRFNDLQSMQEQQSRLLLNKYLIEFNQETNPTPKRLQEIAVSGLEEPILRSLSLLDETGSTWAHAGPMHRPLPNDTAIQLGLGFKHHSTKDSDIYVQPLSSPLLASNGQAVRVWLILETSRSELIISKYESLLSVIGAGIIGLALLYLVISRYIGRWLSPLRAMRESVRAIDTSHLERRVESSASADLADLQNDINAMLASLQEDAEELKSSMTQANDDLQETLEAMEVQNIELTLARKEAIEGNRIKSEFLANISHEIRTPLNGIMGFAKLLLKSQLTPRQLDYVHTIKKSSDSLLAIINDVLDLSKIEAGKLVLENSPLDIEEVIFEVLNMLAPLADEKNIEQVAFIYNDVPQHLMGDPLRLKQVLTNLVNNAIKFTREGEVVVRATLDENSTQPLIRISVSDTGIGLSASARADLFRSFSQGDPSTSREFGGTGLGLVISKHLVEQMGGEINFESTEGKGSTFWFTITAELDKYSQQATIPEDHQHHRILIAESHYTTRQMLISSLEDWGANTHSVDSLASLAHLLEAGEKFDALVVSLPLLDPHNENAEKTIIELQAQHQGPMVLLTRNSDSSQEQAHYQNRFVSVISKPINSRELKQQLQALWRDLDIEEQPFIHATQVLAKNLRVMAVDDNPANLRLISTLLEDLGIEAIPAADGFEACEKARNEKFDLIFMDIQMPGMTGLEATQKIREFEGSKKRTPIVALTAHAMGNEKEKLLKSGLDDYVTKPILENQLIHILSKWTSFNSSTENALHADTASTPTNTDYSANSVAGILDWTESIKLAAGKPELARDMLGMLLNNLENDRRKISKAYAERNTEQLLAHTHYVHGATRYCGVPALRQASYELEAALSADGAFDALAPRLEPLYQTLLSRIDQLIEWRDTFFITPA